MKAKPVLALSNISILLKSILFPAIIFISFFGTLGDPIKPAAAACGTTNVALNKTATASSVEPGTGYTANLAVDGNLSTRWSSAWSDPQWLQVDLGTTQSVCAVTLNWETAYGKAYQIQVSPDASTWTTIYSTTTGTGGTQNLNGLSGSGRYIRMYGTARGTGYGYSLWEFQVFAGSSSATNTPLPATNTPTVQPPTNTPIPPTATSPATKTNTPAPTNTPSAGCGTTNVALNKTATSSSNENASLTPNLAVDGNLSTRWSSAWSDPQWLQVDLGSTMSVCQVVIYWETAAASSFQVQMSPDSSTWTTIYATTTGTGGTQNLTGLSGSGRYIRMYGTTRTTQYGYSIWEFQVYSGSSATSTPTPIPPTNTPVVTSTPSVTPAIGPSPTPVTTSCPPAGTFPLCVINNTRGNFADSQVYLTFLGMPVANNWYYLQPNGTAVHINHLDATAPNHLTKNGVNYPNMSFTLAQAKQIPMPAQWQGGRVYISLGSPMYLAVSSDDSAWAGPDLRNPGDPNADVTFDWYEFTYAYNISPAIPFGGNTTQVDMFGIPMTAELVQSASSYDQTVGITLTHDQVFSRYTASVGSAFQPLALSSGKRIVAPRSSNDFTPLSGNGSQQNYLQPIIDQTWNYYTTNTFNLNAGGTIYTGNVVNGVLNFTDNGAGPFVLNKPTSGDVFACAGALASAGMTTEELALGAQFCAAFNRGVAMNTANWATPSTYYSASLENDYAKFFHSISLANRSYAFAYDDVNDQSSVKILPNSNPPSALIIAVGW